MLVKKAFSGLKSSSAGFRLFPAENLDAMGWRTSYINLDLWLRPSMKPDGFEYYEYILCYVDKMLCISHNMKPGNTKERGITGIIVCGSSTLVRVYHKQSTYFNWKEPY